MTERRWTVNGLGDFSEIYSDDLRTWVRASKRARRRAGVVEVYGTTAAGEQVTFTLNPGEIRLVR